MNTKLTAQLLNEARNSDMRIDRMFYAVHLREIGRMGNRLLKLDPDNQKLKDSLLWLFQEITSFEKKYKLK